MSADSAARTKLTTTFDQDGFVALPAFLDALELRELNDRLSYFIAEVVPTMPREHVFFEEKGRSETLKQLQSLHEYDEYFAKLFTDGKFPELASTLLGDDVVPVNFQYFNKPPGVGQPTPAHQDGYYFMLRPCAAVTMWLALDDVDEENGCVRYVVGSHQRGMRHHSRTKTLGFSQGIADYPSVVEAANEVTCPAKPGDLLVHHALTIHRADGNRSQVRTRRAMGLIYYAARAEVDLAAKSEYQERLTRELVSQEKI